MNELSLAKSLTEALTARQQTAKWEAFIAQILHRIELSPEDFQRAKLKYEQLASQVAKKLDIANTDVHVVLQGSMRTQTTIPSRGNQKFDLDLVVKLSGPRFNNNTDSEIFFEKFGTALRGLNDSSGDPLPKRRCWRLQYPGERFYFDVTPAIPGSETITGTYLRVRDPDTQWSPSNPEEFAEWFCELEKMKFEFTSAVRKAFVMDEAKVDPMPSAPVALDDVPRRFVQFIKLHRDSYYHSLPDVRKEGKPISVILVTLAGQAYRDLYAQRRTFSSPIEVVLELIERLPKYITGNYGSFRVMNPAFPVRTGHLGENFADRWNTDDGMRKKEFDRWHERLVDDLTMLLSEDYDQRSEGRIRGVFGQAGVDAWKASQHKPNILEGLIASAPVRTNPLTVTRPGSKNTLA